MGNKETNNNFFLKFKYNLLIETIWGRFFILLYASLLGGLFQLRARSLMTMFGCYNYADNFLHLCIETRESHTCLTPAKNSSIMKKLYLKVTLKSNNHWISALCNLVGRTYLMVTLKSIVFRLSVTSWVEHTWWLH